MCDKWSQLSIVINVVVTVTSIVVVAIAVAGAALAGFVDVSTATICPAAAADAALWHLLSPGTEQQLIHLGSVPSRLCRQRARCGELKSASAR